jgi:hypothetical protein
VITRESGLAHWASQWRLLRAWKRDLSGVKIKISNRWHRNRLGTCWSMEQRLVIYRGDNFIDELGTLVHELAHAATIGAGHDEQWQEIYATAVTEITGISVVPCADSYRVVNMAAHDAMEAWWVASGNDALWRMARRSAASTP